MPSLKDVPTHVAMTEASREAQNDPAREDMHRKPIRSVNGASRRRLPPGYDAFYVSDAERKRWGIPQDARIKVICGPEMQGAGFGNPLTTFLHQNPEGVIPQNEKGEYLRVGAMGEMIVAYLPAEVWAEIEADNRAKSEAYQRKIEQVGEDDYDTRDVEGNPIDLSNPVMSREMRRRARESLNLMLRDSPTHKIPFERAMDFYSQEETQAAIDRSIKQAAGLSDADLRAARERRAGRSDATDAARNLENARDQIAETSRALARGKAGTWGMGAGFDANGRIVRA